jgi:hypothetical protein
MQVCNHEVTLILFLHPDIILYRPEIIPQVQVPVLRIPLITISFFPFSIRRAKIRNKVQGTRHRKDSRIKKATRSKERFKE